MSQGVMHGLQFCSRFLKNTKDDIFVPFDDNIPDKNVKMTSQFLQTNNFEIFFVMWYSSRSILTENYLWSACLFLTMIDCHSHACWCFSLRGHVAQSDGWRHGRVSWRHRVLPVTTGWKTSLHVSSKTGGESSYQISNPQIRIVKLI